MPVPPRPNILFLFSDQQRWDTVGVYGQPPLPITPNLDRMAREGVLFRYAFSNQPVCGPTRAVLQTGRYATEVGCHINNTIPPPGAMLLAPTLSAAGYEVGYLGKWHLASSGPENGPDCFQAKAVPPERRGGYSDFWLASDILEFTSHGYDGHMFDGEGRRRDFAEGRYRVDAQTDWLLEYLETRKRDRPFFLFCSWIEPHFQNDHGCHEGPHGSKERYRDYAVPGDLAGTEGDWRTEFPDYLGSCASLDENVGRIRAKLEELGLADNTLVIYASDHGSHFRTRNSEYKRSCHDGCIRVPMIACGPGFRGGRVVEDLVSLIDIPPTIVTAAGASVPEAFRGRPLQQVLDGTPADWPREVFLQISESRCGRAIRTPRWTYAVCAAEDAGTLWDHRAAVDVYVEDVLYDNAADPHQRTNLVADPATAAIRDELRATLLRRMAEAGEPAPEILPAQPRPGAGAGAAAATP
jgi:uncharacterized sulfatase